MDWGINGEEREAAMDDFGRQRDLDAEGQRAMMADTGAGRRPPRPTTRAIRFRYTNWRGETGDRRATPISMRFGASRWHGEDQWLMLAYDHDKGVEREFALAACRFN